MSKKIMGMIYKTQEEAEAAFERIIQCINPLSLVGVCHKNMIDTLEGRVHFLSCNEPRKFKGYLFDSVYIDSRVDVDQIVEDDMTLLQLIESRTRFKDPIQVCKDVFDKFKRMRDE